MTDIIRDLRAIESNGEDHTATIRPSFCDECCVRVPCDSAIAAVVACEAADEIERLRADIDIISGYVVGLDAATTTPEALYAIGQLPSVYAALVRHGVAEPKEADHG